VTNDEGDPGWLDVSVAHQRRLLRAKDVVERLELISSSPFYSFWTETKTELEAAAREIRRLRARIAQLEDDTA
jgi:hypothetical protein